MDYKTDIVTINDIFELCGGKDNWAKYYSAFNDCILDFIKKMNFDRSEESLNIIKVISDEVIEDIRESWYRYSLGK